MTHTTNFNLSQWSKTDRIQMADFNADNAKIDAAIANRNVHLYTTTYVGTGSGPRTFTFPRTPRIVFVLGGATFMVGVPGSPYLLSYYLTNGFQITAAWEGCTLTWQHYSGGSIYCANGANQTYTLVALLDADE